MKTSTASTDFLRPVEYFESCGFVEADKEFFRGFSFSFGVLSLCNVFGLC
jgi:hypothetical protein